MKSEVLGVVQHILVFVVKVAVGTGHHLPEKCGHCWEVTDLQWRTVKTHGFIKVKMPTGPIVDVCSPFMFCDFNERSVGRAMNGFLVNTMKAIVIKEH